MNGGSSPATRIRKGHVESPHWLPMDLPETLAAASRSFRENVVLAARCLGQAVSAAITGRLAWTLMLVLLMITTIGSAQVSSPFVQLDRSDTTAGYLASLLINEVPFPGERAYMSEADTRDAMLQILWVLHSRIHQIPPATSSSTSPAFNPRTSLMSSPAPVAGGSARVFIAMRPDSL
jgi:hypothetical protein